MEVYHLSSNYIYASEDFIAGNDIVYTFEVNEPLDTKYIGVSYQELILANPVLQSKWGYNDQKKQFAYDRFEDDEVKRLLLLEREELTKIHPLDDVYSEYSPTNKRLLFRIRQVGEKRIVFLTNHVLNNGMGAFAWIDRWFKLYGESLGLSMPEGESRWNRFVQMEQKQKNGWGKLTDKASSFFDVVRYSMQFKKSAGKNPGNQTVDLTHGVPHQKYTQGYAVKSYQFSEEESRKILRASKMGKRTIKEFFTEMLTEAFLEKYPEKNRVTVSLPIDFRQKYSDVDLYTIGNYTGNMILQVLRNQNVEDQIHENFLEGNKNGIPYKMLDLAGALSGNNHDKLVDKFQSSLGTPTPDRGLFENYTFILSDLGKIEFSSIQKMATSVSGHTKSQTIFISITKFQGKFTLESCISKDAFNPDEVYSVMRLATKKVQTKIADL